MNKKLVLENGMEFVGTSFGSNNEIIAEVVFNTSMVGYQEILSDPSYCKQICVMSYPLIGNYGLTDDDYESKNIYISGFIVDEYNDIPSNFRYTRTLSDVMDEFGVAGIEGIDTRKLVRIIRDQGSQKGLITDISTPHDECMKKLKNFTYPTDQVALSSTKRVWYSRTRNPKYNVCLIDCGAKLNIVRKLNSFNINVVVLPYNTSVSEIEKYNPDGLFISNGPGDPENGNDAIEAIRHFRGKIPICGICFGHQAIALAYGAKTYKMKFGHRGSNHPVLDLVTNKIEITCQNHSYAVDTKSLEGTGLVLTHINLIDGEAEGMEHKEDMVVSCQYHPESAAGPEDSGYWFEKFINLIKENKKCLKK